MDPKIKDINHLYSLFRLYFTPERNKVHSRADLVWRTRKKTTEYVSTRFLLVEKNCEFENMTPENMTKHLLSEEQSVIIAI